MCAGVPKPDAFESCEAYLDCDFESGSCAWDHRADGDAFDWLAGAGATPSSSTGPANDHTTGSTNGGYYFLETSSPRTNGETAYLSSVPVDVTAGATLAFWYHSYGTTVQPISLQIVSCATGTPTTLWTSDGSSQNLWRQAVVALPVQSNARLQFVGTVGGDFRGDVAIDDIAYTPGTTTTTTSTTTTTTTTTASTTTTMFPVVACPVLPEPGCYADARSKLVLKDHVSPKRDRMKWKWAKGEYFDFFEIGEPRIDWTYRVCVYDESAASPRLAASVNLAPSLKWGSQVGRGWYYKDRDLLSDGISKLQIVSAFAGRPKIKLVAKGENLPLPGPFAPDRYFEQAESVTVQLIGQSLWDPPRCWTTQFVNARTRRNDGASFTAVSR